ncbi:MAG: aspartate aminotransferase family protein [Proteobacteria bacterium]|nr:aspartate aminotransferase family protein [Pseudomonadota bacterium]MDA0851480.1 aspartate aminotransferase family protein [Pseudomonadota bacterium]
MKSHIFPRHTRSNLPVAVRGEGSYIFDDSGKSYLDASGGAAVSCLGHAHPTVIKALHRQLDELTYAHTSFFTSEQAEKLAHRLCLEAPKGIDRVYLVSGGSEAVEAALKLARQYYVEKGEPNRKTIIARQQSYHGNTLGALAAGGNKWRRDQFAPLLIDTHHIAPCFAYREKNESENDFEYGQRVANELELKLLELGPETVMAFIAEPVVGATAGAVTAVDGYFRRIREICDKYGVLLVLDEVMCGMGRTGYLYACEHDETRPDIICIAKGLGAGYQPIGAMLCSSAIYAVIENGSGFFQHGHTYLGHPMAAAAANAVLEVLIDQNLLSDVIPKGDALEDLLNANFNQHPHIGDIRGRGLFRAIELVEDRVTKAPFDPELKLATKIKKSAQNNGLLCYPMSGTIDGKLGDHVLLAPPFVISNNELDELVHKLSVTIDQVI